MQVGTRSCTLQLIGRWGRAVVLTYLSGAPLESFHHRLGSAQEVEQVRPDRILQDRVIGADLDVKVEVQELMREHYELVKNFASMKTQVEDAEHKFEGVDTAKPFGGASFNCQLAALCIGAPTSEDPAMRDMRVALYPIVF